MAFLTRDQIIAANKTLPKEVVNIPEWGGDVYVHSLTVKDRTNMAFIADSKDANKKFMALLVIATTFDENGNRLFTDDDIDTVMEFGSAGTSKIFEISSKLNGFSKEEIEELKGNS